MCDAPLRTTCLGNTRDSIWNTRTIFLFYKPTYINQSIGIKAPYIQTTRQMYFTHRVSALLYDEAFPQISPQIRHRFQKLKAPLNKP